MLKGKTKIELTNVHTGETEVIEKENHITPALEWFYKQYGMMKPAYRINEWVKQPYTQFYGGLVAFDKPVPTENGNIFPPVDAKAICHARRGVASTPAGDNTFGIYNPDESYATVNNATKKMTVVYDFSTSRGNGTISSICLCPSYAGYDGFGDAGNLTYSSDYYAIANVYAEYPGIGTIHSYNDTGSVTTIGGAVECEYALYSDHANGLMYYATIVTENDKTYIVIRSQTTPISRVNLWYQHNPYNSDSTAKYYNRTISTHKYEITGYAITSGKQWSCNYSRYDKKIYIVFAASETINANDTFNVMVIDPSDWTSEIISVTNNSSVKLYARYAYCYYGHVLIGSKEVIGEGYTTQYTWLTAIKITDSSLGFESAFKITAHRFGNENVYMNRLHINEIGNYLYTNAYYRTDAPYNGIYGGLKRINVKEVIDKIENPIMYNTRMKMMGLSTESSSNTKTGQCVPDITDPLLVNSELGCCNFGSTYYTKLVPTMHLLFLTTINNLADPIVKTSDQTMKITYTISEADE